MTEVLIIAVMKTSKGGISGCIVGRIHDGLEFARVVDKYMLIVVGVERFQV